MKKLLLILSIAFNVLAIVGGIYVLTSNGTANAGYAVIPMGIAVAFSSLFQFERNKNK